MNGIVLIMQIVFLLQMLFGLKDWVLQPSRQNGPLKPAAKCHARRRRLSVFSFSSLRKIFHHFLSTERPLFALHQSYMWTGQDGCQPFPTLRSNIPADIKTEITASVAGRRPRCQATAGFVTRVAAPDGAIATQVLSLK